MVILDVFEVGTETLSPKVRRGTETDMVQQDKEVMNEPVSKRVAGQMP